MSFVGFLEAAGKDFLKGLSYVVKVALPVETLTKPLFPQFAPAITAGVDVATLIQNAVLVVEQKFAAAGKQSGTGAQKLAEVMALSEGAVTAILTQFGVHADTAYVTSLVNAVVAVLNVSVAPVGSKTS